MSETLTYLPTGSNDYAVIWKNRPIGRIRLAAGVTNGQSAIWVWRISPPMAVPAWGSGTANSLERAKQKFQAYFDRFCSETSEAEWKSAFRKMDTATKLHK